MSANRVAPRLWQGSIPPEGTDLGRQGFTLLVLAAAEHQPPASCFPGLRRVVHAPFDDHVPTAAELAIAEQAASQVAAALCAGDRVLVTCFSGLNRSGLIVARSMVMLGTPAESAIRKVRRARGPRALGNEHFVRALLGR